MISAPLQGNLGSFGIVSRITLKVAPLFNVVSHDLHFTPEEWLTPGTMERVFFGDNNKATNEVRVQCWFCAFFF